MKNLDNLAKLHNIRKQQMVYETKRDMAFKRFLAKATAHIDTPRLRKEVKIMFDANYPAFKPCPVEGSKLSRCPECGHINTNKKK